MQLIVVEYTKLIAESSSLGTLFSLRTIFAQCYSAVYSGPQCLCDASDISGRRGVAKGGLEGKENNTPSFSWRVIDKTIRVSNVQKSERKESIYASWLGKRL